jgi:Bacterial Ig-like domain
MPISRSFLLVLFSAVLLAIAAGSPVAANAQSGDACAPTGQETVVTDKDRYSTTETVQITGSGYAPACRVTVDVVRPDGSVVRGDGSEMPGGDSVTTGADGGLSHQYQLSTMTGTYAVNVIGADNALLATTTFEDSADVQRLRLGPGGPLNRAFTAGNTVHAEGVVDGNRHYRWRVLDGSGTVRHVSTCVSSGTSTTPVSNSYVIGSADPVSGSSSQAWRYELQQFSGSNRAINCAMGTSVDSADFMDFRVAKATAYGSTALTTPKTLFKAGDTAFVVAQGVFPGQALRIHWIRPNGTTACSQTTNSGSWPSSNASGRLPSTNTSYVRYLPNSSDPANHNKTTAYSSTCPALGSAQGLWRMRVEFFGRSGIDVEEVDLAAFTVDTTAPMASIDAQPADPSNDVSPRFEFSGTDNHSPAAALSLECKLDAGAWAACSSPQDFAGLGEGSHTFSVRATDEAGNVGAADSHTWTVDSVKPSSSASSPATTNSIGNTIHVNYTAADAAPSSELDKVDLYAKKDDGAWEKVATDSSPSGSGSFQYEHSGDGTYSFYTIATDRAGNQEATPTHPDDETVVVADSTTLRDTVAPAPTLNAPPALTSDDTPTVSGTAGTQGATTSTSADAGTVTVTILQGSTVEQAHADVPVDAGGSFSVDADHLPDGSYTAKVEQSDGAGNTGSDTRDFSVDATAPAPPSVTSPPDNSYSTTGNLTVSGTAESNSTVEVFDGGESKGTTTADGDGNWSIELTSVPDGVHTYTAKAADGAGNTSEGSNARTVTVDTLTPKSQASSPATSNTKTFTVGYTATEAGSGLEQVELWAKKPGDSGYSKADTDTTPDETRSFSYTAGADGEYRFYTLAYDKAGNVENVSGVVDTITIVTTVAAFDWTGFFNPIEGTDSTTIYNTVNSGRAIPMKFSLGGYQGMNVIAAGYPTSGQFACNSGATLDPVETTVAANSSGLNYDTDANQYNYVWKTSSGWAGQCRQFVLKLTDGSYHRANFLFKR